MINSLLLLSVVQNRSACLSFSRLDMALATWPLACFAMSVTKSELDHQVETPFVLPSGRTINLASSVLLSSSIP